MVKKLSGLVLPRLVRLSEGSSIAGAPLVLDGWMMGHEEGDPLALSKGAILFSFLKHPGCPGHLGHLGLPYSAPGHLDQIRVLIVISNVILTSLIIY